MAPEALMLLIDSSEYMRNGDFTPTRFEAQLDAISVIFNAKVNANPENTVGVMTMGGPGGSGPQVLATPTNDLGKILSALHKATIGGESDLHTGLQVAQNKTQRQRILLLLGSPLSESTTEQELVKLGKKLKKNNVAVDVVTFVGETEAGGPTSSVETVLGRFVDSVQSGENSHILSVPPGPHLLSDIIASSPILHGEDGFPAGQAADGSGAGTSNFEFGVDPDMDPELAMVLRMSMEEEQARQARATGGSEPEPSAAPALATVVEVPTPAAGAVEEAEPASVVSQVESKATDGDVEMGGQEEDEEDEDDEEEAIRKAIEMSMQENQDKDKQ